MTYERELKKYQDSIGVKVQYKIVVDFYHHQKNHNLLYPLVLETTYDKSYAKVLQKLYKKRIRKEGDDFFLEHIQVEGKYVDIEEEYVYSS